VGTFGATATFTPMPIRNVPLSLPAASSSMMEPEI
jgi:hypothetical protein